MYIANVNWLMMSLVMLFSKFASTVSKVSSRHTVLCVFQE